MLNQTETKPGLHVYQLAFAADVFNYHPALIMAPIEHHAHLLQLADGIRIPVSGHWTI
jgi:hypothetical protein